MTALLIILGYLALLLAVALTSSRFSRGTSEDFFLASRSIGPFLLLMSLFGTTMTAFALVGSTGKSYNLGVGVYGLMASWAAVVHPLMFALVGLKLWQLGKRHNYVTQVQYFRDRFQSERLGQVLFPILVLLVIPYLLIGVQGAGITVAAVTKGAFPTFFVDAAGLPSGIPSWLTGAVICSVVLTYVFWGGIRAAAWANGFQTCIFIVVAVLTFFTISSALGGVEAATAATMSKRPELLIRGQSIGQAQFLSYGLVGMSVGMFPHIFQHWMTAKSSSTFKLPVIAHPVLVAVVWLPCVLLGIWAAGQLSVPPEKANAVLGIMVAKYTTPVMSGVLTAGILAAIMSSLDSQFLCLGTMFTHDVVLRGETLGAADDARVIWIGRAFVTGVVVVTYLLSLVSNRGIFDLGVWCFSGFSGLTPLVIAALYWRRATRAGAIACVLAVVVSWSVLFAMDSLGMGGPHGEFLLGGVMPVTWVFLSATIAMVVGSLLSTPPDADHIRRFF
jgi:SSS family solute:Na+ symporter